MTDFKIPAEMRALVLAGSGYENLSVQKVPVPKPNSNQMLARVDAAGICTSLLKLIDQGSNHQLLSGWDITQWPIILGDEGCVTLVEVGEHLRGTYQAGQRFVIQPAVDSEPINHTERYRDGGRGVHKIAVGYSLGGHLAEYILITEEILKAGCLLPMPAKSLPYAHAAIAEPMSCVISGQDHHMHLVQADPVKPRQATNGLLTGGVAVIVGAGAMGRIHVELALSYRPRMLIVADFNEQRLGLVDSLFGGRAERAGVKMVTINAQKTNLKDFVLEQTLYLGADDVIIAVGARQPIEEAMVYAGQGAVLNLFGGLKKGEEIVGFDTIAIHYKSINITGSSGGSPWDVARTLELMAAGDIDPTVHITRIGDLEHAIEFLQMIKKQEIDGKAVVYPHHRTDQILVVPSWSAEDEKRYLKNQD
jgi:threonine dehydrogenase-like Zn-dependent dehydrogenase